MQAQLMTTLTLNNRGLPSVWPALLMGRRDLTSSGDWFMCVGVCGGGGTGEWLALLLPVCVYFQAYLYVFHACVCVRALQSCALFLPHPLLMACWSRLAASSFPAPVVTPLCDSNSQRAQTVSLPRRKWKLVKITMLVLKIAHIVGLQVCLFPPLCD